MTYIRTMNINCRTSRTTVKNSTLSIFQWNEYVEPFPFNPLNLLTFCISLVRGMLLCSVLKYAKKIRIISIRVTFV